jgi:hypothetical protein
MKTFIDEHSDAYGIEPICKVLPIAPSTYYTHAARRSNRERQPARARRDAARARACHGASWAPFYPAP